MCCSMCNGVGTIVQGVYTWLCITFNGVVYYSYFSFAIYINNFLVEIQQIDRGGKNCAENQILCYYHIGTCPNCQRLIPKNIGE